MREELKENEVTEVTGGKVYINSRTKKLGFTSISGVYDLKCSPYDAVELCDSLIGQYPSDAEYDQACFNALKAKGWI